MKKLLILAAVAVSALTISAQSFEDFFSTQKSNEKITIGFRAGLNVNGMRNNIGNNDVAKIFSDLPYKIDVHNKAAINFGVNVDIPILKNLWINTGAYYSTTGAKLSFKQDFGKDYEGFLPEYTANVTMHNIRIPVQASYRYNINNDYQLQVNLGPYFAYGFGGKANVKDDVDGDKVGHLDLTGNSSTLDTASDEYYMLGENGVNTNNSNYIKPFDMGIAIGAGVTFKQKFFAGINYDAGLVNVNGKRARALIHNSIKNHVFSLNFGYNF